MKDVKVNDEKDSIWLIILAAGLSRRMGARKQLLSVGDAGESMVRHVVQKALAAKAANVANAAIREVAVVVNSGNLVNLGNRETHGNSGDSETHGADRDNGNGMNFGAGCDPEEAAPDPDILHELTGLHQVRVVLNRFASAGMSSSLKVGIQTALENGASAAVILLGDQPGLDPRTLDAVVNAYGSTQARIVQIHYLDGPGHPVLFDRSMFEELLQVEGDKGARDVIRRNAAAVRRIAFPAKQPMDIDTPEDYQVYLKTKGVSQKPGF